eukprot:6208898-Amphidinium_carterae.1
MHKHKDLIHALRLCIHFANPIRHPVHSFMWCWSTPFVTHKCCATACALGGHARARPSLLLHETEGHQRTSKTQSCTLCVATLAILDAQLGRIDINPKNW